MFSVCSSKGPLLSNLASPTSNQRNLNPASHWGMTVTVKSTRTSSTVPHGQRSMRLKYPRRAVRAHPTAGNAPKCKCNKTVHCHQRHRVMIHFITTPRGLSIIPNSIGYIGVDGISYRFVEDQQIGGCRYRLYGTIYRSPSIHANTIIISQYHVII